MRLLDYAKVIVGNGHWMKGWEAEDRMHGLSVEIFDPCGVTETPVISRIGAVSEVQRVAITGAPTSGWFSLRLDGGETGQIAYNASAATVATALDAITSRQFTVAGGPGPATPWTVTFNDGNVAQMTTTASLVGGTNPAVAVTTTTPGATGGTIVYRVGAFGIKADLPRSLMCTQEDDEKWLEAVTKAAAETGVGRAACIEHAEDSDTWIGDSLAQTAATIEAGRIVWQTHNVGVPALHLADDQMIDALNAKVILSLGDQMMTVWGDPVVNSPGYVAGAIFWTGPIEVYLSTIDTDLLFKSSNNEARVIANIVAALDMPPGQIVKVTAV